MALVYRAIWQDRIADAGGLAERCFFEWVASKKERWGLAIEPPDTSGESRGESPDGVVRWIDRTSQCGSGRRLRLVEERTAETYTTTLTFSIGESAETWWWVDLERDSADPFQRYRTIAPHLISSLLHGSRTEGGDPRLGDIRLRSDPAVFESPDILKSLICRDDRQVPIVVFSHDPRHRPATTLDRAVSAAEVVAGVALVVALPDGHVDAYEEIIGEDLAVSGGDARIYLPLGGAHRDIRRHRRINVSRLGHSPRAAALRISHVVASAVASRRPPRQLSGLDWGGVTASEDEWISVLEADNERLSSFERLAEDRALEIIELSEELAAVRANMALLVAASRPSGDEDVADAGPAIPEDLKSIEEVVRAASTALSRVSIPETALQAVDEMDAHILGEEWARSIRLALMSLQAYAERPGGYVRFDYWCDANAVSEPHVWPSTRFAPGETGETKRKFRGTRVFSVDAELDDSGSREMLMHLKVSGEADLGPRIYFYDDIKGDTGRIHVGFVGPHYLVPNTKSER